MKIAFTQKSFTSVGEGNVYVIYKLFHVMQLDLVQLCYNSKIFALGRWCMTFISWNKPDKNNYTFLVYKIFAQYTLTMGLFAKCIK